MNHFTSSDGLNLAYSDQGRGIPVLCLAGLTRNMADFDDFAAVHGARCRLISMDYRGRGASDYDPVYANYAVPVEARDALELLDHLGIPKAVIVGTSRGGFIAMVLAATAKERLAGVLLNDIGPELDPVGLGQIMGYLGRDPAYGTYVQAAVELPEVYAGQFENVPAGRWQACAERWWKETRDGLRIRYDRKLRNAVEEASAQPAADLWPLFAALNGLPLALVRGANSNLLSEATTERMRAERPDMIFAQTPDRGHVPFLDEPEAVAAFNSLMERVSL